jgi:hypothetical protein
MHRIIKNTIRCRRSGHKRAATNQRACCRIETREPSQVGELCRNYTITCTDKMRNETMASEMAMKVAQKR